MTERNETTENLDCVFIKAVKQSKVAIAAYNGQGYAEFIPENMEQMQKFIDAYKDIMLEENIVKNKDELAMPKRVKFDARMEFNFSLQNTGKSTLGSFSFDSHSTMLDSARELMNLALITQNPDDIEGAELVLAAAYGASKKVGRESAKALVLEDKKAIQNARASALIGSLSSQKDIGAIR